MAMRRLLASVGTPNAWRRMSTLEKLQIKVDLSPKVLTSSPTGGEPADLNKFFEISDDALKASFPNGVHPDLNVLFTRLSRNRLMVRAPALGVMDLMRAAGADPTEAAASDSASAAAAPGLVVLASAGGKAEVVRGVGKTATLTHCVHWARAHGWLVLHVPTATTVMFGGYWVEPSREVEGDFDQPQVATEILANFLLAHGDLLETLATVTAAAQAGLTKLPRDGAAAAKGGLKKGAAAEGAGDGAPRVAFPTLAALCRAGVADEDLASRCVVLLRAELAEVDAVPVLVAIDEWSCLFEHSSHYYEGHNIPAERLTLVRALRDLAPCGTQPAPALPLGDAHAQADGAPRGWLKRGLVLAAETNRMPRSPARDYFGKGGPGYHLKGGKGEGAGARRVAVGNFSPAEFSAACDFFAESEVLNNDGRDTRGAMALYSQFNPAVLVERAMLS